MINGQQWRRWLLGTLAAAFAPAVLAAPVTYFGADLSPGGQVPVGGASATARGTLQGLLAKSESDGLESYAVGGKPATLFSGAAKLTVDGSDSFATIENDPSLGRFNTTSGGSRWWTVTRSFEIFFDVQTFSAFGFYGTDLADFGGGLSLELLDASRNVVGNALTIPSSGGTNNGALLFFGVSDADRSYSGVRFLITQSDPTDPDGLGFDDLLVGSLSSPPPIPTPEPGSLALVGLSLLTLAATRRRLR